MSELKLAIMLRLDFSEVEADDVILQMKDEIAEGISAEMILQSYGFDSSFAKDLK